MAVSTGANLQQSSRLLSAANASGLAFLPSGKQAYECRGKTEVVLLERIQDLPTLSPEGFEMLQKLYGTTVLANTGCSGSCSAAAVKSAAAKKFGVYCITVSDRAAAGQYETGDLSGKSMTECIAENPEKFELIGTKIVRDEKEEIQQAIREVIALNDERLALILTSGGTGFAVRDVTPDAVSALIVRRADSLNMMMQAAALEYTPLACASRSVIGMIPCADERSEALIITLPGKPKAVKEMFEILMRKNVLLHCLKMLRGY